MQQQAPHKPFTWQKAHSLHPLDQIVCPLFSEVSQQGGEVLKIRYQPSIVASWPQELAHTQFLLFYQFRDAHGLCGHPDTVLLPAQLHTILGLL